MSMLTHGKYIFDSSGRVVEVILPFKEFIDLKRRAGDNLSRLPSSLKAVKETDEMLSHIITKNE